MIICQPPHRIALLMLAFTAMANGGTTPATNSNLSAEEHALPWIEGRHLTGDWWGLCGTLADSELSVDLSYNGVYLGTLSGSGAGSDRFEYGHRFDALINLDTGKLGLWDGGGFHTHLSTGDKIGIEMFEFRKNDSPHPPDLRAPQPILHPLKAAAKRR